MSESYVYKILPGPAASARETARLAEVARVRHGLALQRLAVGDRVKPAPSLAQLRETARLAEKKRAFEAQKEAFLAAHYADLL